MFGCADPPNAGSEIWIRLNDGNDNNNDNYMTTSVNGAWVELDFGQERMSNKVRMVHWNCAWSNGTTLTVMNNNREVLFEHVFENTTDLVYTHTW